MWTKYIISLLFIYFIDYGKTERILAVFPLFSKSHLLVAQPLIDGLAQKGHQITLISPYKSKERRENVEEIVLDGIQEYFDEQGILNHFFNQKSIFEGLTDLIYGTAELVNFTLSYPEVQKLLKSDAKFDLLIIDVFQTDSLLGLAHYYGIPSIAICSSGTNIWTNEPVGNPDNPAFNPNLFLGFTDNMALYERVINSLLYIFSKISYRYLYLPAQETIYRRYFTDIQPEKELPPLIDLIHNISLIFLNTHPALHYPRAYVPNIIEIGGIHLKKPKSLPKDITNFVELGYGGTIYFSLGANLKSTDLPKEKLEAFQKVFLSMPTVGIIWKWEDRLMPNQPDNVVIGPWLPQIDILANKNVSLFITHGGLLSIYEGLATNTPILGIPIFGDQHANMAMVEKHKFGRTLNYDNITEESVREMVEEMLNNPIYKENVKRVSKLVNDNLVSPLDKAIYYVEYVLRTGGAHHLRSSAVELPFWQSYLLDVGFIFLVGIVLILAVPSVIIGILLRNTHKNAVVKVTNTKTKALSKNGNSHKKKQ